MDTRKSDSAGLTAWGLPADLQRGSPRDPQLARRILTAALVLIVASGAGVGIVHARPLLVIGLVAAVLLALLVLARPFWGLLLYTLIFIWRPGELYPALAALHLERIMGLLTLASMLVAQHRRYGHLVIDRSLQTYLLLAFAATVLLSVPFAYWRAEAMDGFIEVVKILIFYLLVVHLVDTRRRLRLFVGLLMILTAYIGASSFWDYLHRVG